MTNLTTGTEYDIRTFLSDVMDQAVSDYRAGRKTPRTGRWLTSAYADDYRLMHYKLASMVYRQTYRTMELSDRDRARTPATE